MCNCFPDCLIPADSPGNQVLLNDGNGVYTDSGVSFGASGGRGAALADFDGDLSVGFADFLIFVSGFGSVEGQPKYQAVLDMNSDGLIGFPDFLIFANAFGTRYAAGKVAPAVVPEDNDAKVFLNGKDPGLHDITRIVANNNLLGGSNC